MLKIYTLEQSEQWDKIVRSFKKYDVYWLSGYVKAFKIHGDGEPLLFYYEGNACHAINVVMKRDIAYDKHFKGKLEIGKYFDFATPYGYGGWLIEWSNTVNTTEELFTAYNEWLSENKIICEFVRFHPMLENHLSCTRFYEVFQLGRVIHMDLISPEIVWSNVSSKNRNVIRKAVKNGVRIYNGRYPKIYKDFREIYNKTMNKDDAEKYYYFGENFYESVLEDLPLNAQVFFAEKEGLVIAASIILCANGRMNYHLSGSLKEFNSFAPTNLLLYKAALWGCANGYKTFYLGGGVGSSEDSLFKFKRAFHRGEDLRSFYIGKKISDRNKYEELVRMREITGNRYFPKYRA